MAFQEIDPAAGVGPRAKINTVSIWSAADGACFLVLSGDIYEQIGAPPFARLLLGSGEHAGLVAVVPQTMASDASYKFIRMNPAAKQYKVTVASAKIGIPRAKRQTTSLPFEITEDGLIVDLRQLRKPALAAAE
jgi:hypothetical protein